MAATLASVTAGMFLGCAESPAPMDDETDGVPVVDSGPSKPSKKDASSDATSSTPEDDSGLDDAGLDASSVDDKDAGGNGGKDAGFDAGKDAGNNGGKDSGAPDAGLPDAGPSPDAGTTPDAGDPGARKPVQGEIVISEVMFNPSTPEPLSEWFEIYNTTTETLSLSGLTIKDKSRSKVVAAGVTIEPGSYGVLVRDEKTATSYGLSGPAIIYDYGEGALSGDSKAISLTNDSTGDLTVLDGTTEIARAHYGALGFGSTSGASIQLKVLTYVDAGNKVNWCKSTKAWATGDFGTPGAASDCP